MSLQQVLQQAADRVVATEPVPGAILGASVAGETCVAVAGVADVRTHAAMTPETLFLFGSVAKVWVTTLLMSLVDEGLIDLDTPVVDYLPGFRVASPTATRRITVRMLITHSSGLDAADLIVDLGDHDEVLAQYVEMLADKEQLHAPGAMASYNNAAFVVAGRLIEVVTGRRWADVMRERIFEPLHLGRTCLATGGAPPLDTAIGHFPGADGPTPTPRFLLPAALAPAGSNLLVTAHDALMFARMHLGGGPPVLSGDSARAMTDPQLSWPAPGTGGIAHGWWWDPGDDITVFSHTGGSLGGLALLAIAPGHDLAVVGYVNSTASATAIPAMKQAVFDQFGLSISEPTPLPFVDVDPAEFLGTYNRFGLTVEIREGAAGLELTTKPELEVVVDYLSGQALTLPCRPVGERALALAPTPETTAGLPLAWLIGDKDGPKYLYLGGRLARQVGR